MFRRTFLTQGTAVMAATCLGGNRSHAAAEPAVKFGTCRLGMAQAKEAGLDGVELGVGEAAERLEIADAAVVGRYKAQAEQTKMQVCSLMMGLFNSHPLASDARGSAWLEQSIDAAEQLGAKVILLAFFGDGDLLDAAGKPKDDAMDAIVRRIKQAAPRAKDAGVVLGIENYLNGEQNARILDRIQHESVGIYYDVFNTGTTKGHNVPRDLRLLQGRIAQVHFKNGPKFLDEESPKFEQAAATLKAIRYRGWAVLETSNPTGNPVADTRRNAAYLRRSFA